MQDIKDVLVERNVAEIRIVSLNVDKSRKDSGSASRYHLYFQLSHYPTTEWNCQFGLAWKNLRPDFKVEIDRGFLVLHCELQEVANTLLPSLKIAVREANFAFQASTIKEASERQQREQVWLRERDGVEALASALHFD